MKSLHFVIWFAYLISFAVQKHVDFTGEYLINKNQSQFNGLPEYVLPRLLKVKQKDQLMIIWKIVLNQDLKDKPVSVDSLRFDSTPFKRLYLATPGGTVRSTIKWQTETSFQYDQHNQNVDGSLRLKITEMWSIEEKGRVLKVVRNAEQGDGTKYSVLGIYHKK